MVRCGRIERKTTETDVSVEISLDGTGKSDIATTIPFFDHMLTLVARHGLFDLVVKGTGDIDVDYHHLVEDTGLCLGAALVKALGDKKGIRRYGFASIPMDESLCQTSIDLSGRSNLIFNAALERGAIRDFDPLLTREFFKALCDEGGITLHVTVAYGTNFHHMVESIFKSFAHALDNATSLDRRIEGVLSTKGSI